MALEDLSRAIAIALALLAATPGSYALIPSSHLNRKQIRLLRGSNKMSVRLALPRNTPAAPPSMLLD
jgi:hypothetical protein